MSWFDVEDFNQYKKWGSSVGRTNAYVIYARMYAPDALLEATEYIQGKTPTQTIWDLLKDYNSRFKEIIQDIYGVNLDSIDTPSFIKFALKTDLIVVDHINGLPVYAKKRLYLLGEKILSVLQGFGDPTDY